MRILSITVELTRSYCEEVEVTDEQYEAYVNGKIDVEDIPQIDLKGQLNECRCGDCCESWDYTIDDDEGRTLKEWDEVW